MLCHREAHVAVDECGAPEFFGDGLKLIGLPGVAGKLAPDTVAAAIGRLAEGRPHVTRPAALSLTQVTEAGTVYRAAELRSLADIAHGAGLKVHLDGARFANAVAALDASPADLSWRAGIDILSFGATKNGPMAAEAIVAFDPASADTVHERRKRGGHLLSKHRFLAAQFDAYLADDLWLDLARHANAMAALLAKRMRAAGLDPVWPVDANLVFVILPAATDARLRAAGARYYARHSDSLPEHRALRPGDVLARFVTSFATTPADIDALMAAFDAPDAP